MDLKATLNGSRSSSVWVHISIYISVAGLSNSSSPLASKLAPKPAPSSGTASSKEVSSSSKEVSASSKEASGVANDTTSASDNNTQTVQPRNPSKDHQSITLPKIPSSPKKLLGSIAREHGVPDFPINLRDYVNGIEQLHAATPIVYDPLPFQRIDVFHSFKFSREGLLDDTMARDWVRATPVDDRRFDTVVVLTDDDAESTGLDGSLSSYSLLASH